MLSLTQIKHGYIVAKAKEIIVQESVEELQKYLRKASCQIIKKRIKMLIVIKKREPEMLSKNELAKLCKCNHNSINSWRRLYLNGGMDAIKRRIFFVGIAQLLTFLSSGEDYEDMVLSGKTRHDFLKDYLS